MITKEKDAMHEKRVKDIRPLAGSQVRIRKCQKASGEKIRMTYQVVIECGKGELRARMIRAAVSSFLLELREKAKPDDQLNAGADELLATCDIKLPMGGSTAAKSAAKTDNGIGVTSAGGESGLPHRSQRELLARCEQIATENAAMRNEIRSTLTLLDGYVQEVRNDWSDFDGRQNRSIVFGIVEELRKYSASTLSDNGGTNGR